jgi:hypothetical protein
MRSPVYSARRKHLHLCSAPCAAPSGLSFGRMEYLLWFAQAVATGTKLRREFLAAVDDYAARHDMTREEVLDVLAEKARTAGKAAAERVIIETRRLAHNPAFWYAGSAIARRRRR